MKFKTKEEAIKYLMETQGLSVDVAEKLAMDYVEIAPSPASVNSNLSVQAGDKDDLKLLQEAIQATKNAVTETEIREIIKKAAKEDAELREKDEKIKIQRQFETRIDNLRASIIPDYKNFVEDVANIAFALSITQQLKNCKDVPFGDLNIAKRVLGVKNNDEFEMLVQASNREYALRPSVAGSGQEFVMSIVSNQLLDTVRVKEAWMSKITEIDMPADPYLLPQITADATFYGAGSGAGTIGDPGGGDSAVAVQTSNPTTARVTLSANKFIASVPFDDDMEQDSIIPVIPMIQANLVNAAAPMIAQVILRGDTTTGTTNINYDGGTPSQAAGAADSWLMSNGLVKLLLDGGSAYYTNANATLALSHFQAVVKSLDEYGLEFDRCFWAMGPETYFALRTLLAPTAGNEGPLNSAGYVENGRAVLYGYEAYPTLGLPLTNDNGKISSTAANNDQKNAVWANGRWIVKGNRKGMTFETFRTIAMQNYLTALMRFDVQFPKTVNTGRYLYNAD